MTIVAIVGMPGAGKTEVTKIFENNNFVKVYLGQLTFDTLKQENKEPTEVNQREVRERLRKQHGMAAYAKLNLEKVQQLHKSGKDIVLESFYSWSSYKLYKEIFQDNFIVVAVVAPTTLRHKRLLERKTRTHTKEEAVSRDSSQIENLEQAGPIANADYFILNELDLLRLENNAKEVINAIRQN